jgi:hypothetical protein
VADVVGGPCGVVEGEYTEELLGSYPRARRRSCTFCLNMTPAKAHVDRMSGYGQRTRLMVFTTDDSTGCEAHSRPSSVQRKLGSVSRGSSGKSTNG